ncbi:MAG: dihydrolipoamide acetyltransferase family protein [Gemmatimonadota bacterium]|jgi:pyruvate dehydrogenase E2 component (dihydrolipoamide acetyltransferase)
MATKVHMEALSPTMEEGQLVRWLKKEGDAVAEGDILAEIETDKATMELVARGSGILRVVGLAEGGTAPVGTVIAVIGAADEDVEGIVDSGAGTEAGAAPTAAAPAAAAEETAGPGAGTVGAAAAPAAGPGGRVKASPLARRLAAEAGLEIAGIAGSGPGGRVVKRDVEAAAAAPRAAAPSFAVPAGPEVEEVPVTQMRKTIAKRLVTSIGPVPTFYLTIEVDVTRLLAARESVNARLEREGGKASINDFIVKAVAMALARHPEVNAQWADTVIRRFRRVHVGVAVAVEDGLITPVVKDADRKGIAQIAVEVRELAARGRERKLQPDEYTGATFSISNLGMFGIDEFTAIINPPESGILAVGQVAEKIVAEMGEAVVRPRMRMTMSCDHRVVDGATGARFLQTVREFIEEPAMMLV